ncbi:MAG: alpha/beta fold hydrolase [Pseudomonadota bacterium]
MQLLDLSSAEVVPARAGTGLEGFIFANLRQAVGAGFDPDAPLAACDAQALEAGAALVAPLVDQGALRALVADGLSAAQLYAWALRQVGPVFNRIVPRLTTVRAGRNFLFLHPVSGTVAFYALCANHLRGAGSAYAAQCPGFNPGEEAVPSISAMADAYIAQMRTLAADYVPIGYSMGCLTALDIHGKLFDGRGRRLVLVAPNRQIRNQRLAVRTKQAIVRRKSWLYGLAFAEREEVEVGSPVFRKLVAMYENNIYAVEEHEARPVDSDVLLIMPADDPRDFTDEVVALWRAQTRGRLDVVLSPGTHTTIVQEPHAKPLAARIAEAVGA